MIRTTLGGISVASPPPAQMLPSAMSLSYFRLSIAGRATTPTVTTPAPRPPPRPDVDGAEELLGDAGPLEHARHEDEERHGHEDVIAHQREDAAHDQAQALRS